MASYTGGSHATSRIQALEAERRKQQTEIERRRDNIAAAVNAVTKAASGSNYSTRSETVEDMLKSETVGLVSHDDFKARRQYFERCAAGEREKREAALRDKELKERRLRLKKANKSRLSFCGDDPDDEDSDDNGDSVPKSPVFQKRVRDTSIDSQTVEDHENSAANSPETIPKRRRLGKNPDVDTTFLPDKDRELAEKAERERLKQEWLNQQEAIKSEVVKITYSYWDGAGHRRVLSCKKGTTIGRFLAMVQTQFKELRNTSADSLMFIKEDLIIPTHYSFYDFLVTKARGKSGPLFNFDVVEDVRVIGDANKEKEDAHAAKIVERRWYERNRHIFPASRWEVYDPAKNYSRYTIHGD